MTSNKNSTRFYSGRQEAALAKRFKATLQANSGAGAFKKGDFTDGLFLYDAKTSVKPRSTFPVHKEDLNKIREEAFAMDRQSGALVFDFGDSGEAYVVLPEKEFLRLRDLCVCYTAAASEQAKKGKIITVH